MSGTPKISGAGTKWLLKMAWRDGRASGKRLLLFIASIVLGIAAVVSIQSFSANLEDNIALQSKELMGADFRIRSSQPPNERVLEVADSLGGANGREVNFASMAAFPKNGASKLMRVRGIGGGFPFYGKLKTRPESAATEYLKVKGALVDATVMLQFGLELGDSIKIGDTTFPISGTLYSAPGSTAISTSVAPSVIVPHDMIEGTGLLKMGSRVQYNLYFVADPEMDLRPLDAIIDPMLVVEDADMDTHLATSERLGRRFNNVGKFLNLIAFIALLLGCVGIASSVHIYIKEKLRAVAVLKCLGASRKQSFLIFLIQITGMGLLGGVIGTILGLLLQQSFPLLLQEFLPFEVVVSYSIQPIIMGLLLGVGVSVLFALSPLLSTWYVSPLQVLRVQKETSAQSKRATILVMLGIVLFMFCFSLWLLGNVRYTLGFVLGIVVTFGILAGVAHIFMGAVKKFFPYSWSFTARQSLLNLFRPNNQTMVLLLAIGVGSFLISTLYFTKDILLEKATLEGKENSPNIIMLDVQTDQRSAMRQEILNKGLPVVNDIPIITMRMHSIKGRSVNDIRVDTLSQVKQWILNHEFRVTYRDSLIPSEELIEGEFTPSATADATIPISLSENVASDAQVILGDTLVFNVQGVLMETVVGSIRDVDWGRMQINFSVVFPNGVLENAPQFYVVSTKAPDQSVSASLQKEVVRKFPNVSVLDLRQMLTLVEGILDKIAWVINFMAFFSILTGIIVLIGSVRTSKYQRIRESVLLRTLGAKSGQILRITALEYLYLGLLGGGIGVLLSLVSSQLVALFVFQTAFIPSLIPFLIILPGITALVIFIGLFNSRSVLNSPPLEVLRKEV